MNEQIIAEAAGVGKGPQEFEMLLRQDGPDRLHCRLVPLMAIFSGSPP